VTAKLQAHWPFVVFRCGLVVVVSLLGLGLASTPAADAATVRLVAVGGSNTGDCSASPCATIAYAIGQSNNGDTISVSVGTYTQLGITVDKDLTISGAGASATTVQAAAAANTAADRVFLINNGVTATIENMAITHGNAGADLGAGIRNNGALTVVNALISGNSTTRDGGGAAIGSFGPLIVRNSTLSDNHGGVGGAIYNALTTVTIISSTFSNNSANLLGGAIDNAGTMTVTDSTLYNNTVGGLSNEGGGGIFDCACGMLTINNSTLNGNKVTLSFGRGGAIDNEGTLVLNSSTLSANSAAGTTNGGGITNAGTAILRNTIIADSTQGNNCDNAVTSLGHNLSSDDTCTLDHAGDLTNTSPLLGPLAANGGPTPTQALLPGSPAIDAGDNGSCPATDQRGIARPLGAGCDIGAYEALIYKIYSPVVAR